MCFRRPMVVLSQTCNGSFYSAFTSLSSKNDENPLKTHQTPKSAALSSDKEIEGITENRSNHRKTKKGRFSADLGAVAVIARSTEFPSKLLKLHGSRGVPSKPKKRQFWALKSTFSSRNVPPSYRLKLLV